MNFPPLLHFWFLLKSGHGLLSSLDLWTLYIFVFLPTTCKYSCRTNWLLCWAIVNSVCTISRSQCFTLFSDPVFSLSEERDEVVKMFWRTWPVELHFLRSLASLLTICKLLDKLFGFSLLHYSSVKWRLSWYLPCR